MKEESCLIQSIVRDLPKKRSAKQTILVAIITLNLKINNAYLY